ncbi:MAG TPA: HAMP domain-containing histidine kinase [Candidatus Hungatella pullicola]|nr:HAMP domain-containing histidine kinase [Candidatus Hungatella pullicola]
MFKKSKRKIIGALLAVLVILLFGTMCVIYLASYAEMTRENRSLLEQYVSDYTLEEKTGKPAPGRPEGAPHRRPFNPPRLELSTFYSVAVSKNGQILKVDTADVSTIEEESLTQLAADIIERGKKSGVERHLIYQAEDKGSYILVAFLDNTVMVENVETLISYTLIFGAAALVLLFFLARYLADRIVAPLEESYKRQKQFVSDAGHELKTPVAVVNTNLEVLSRQIGENQWLSNIQYENQRMSALISQLLDLARTENAAPQMETVDLSHLVCGETLPFETVAYENGLVLNSDIEESICMDGNSVQLKQLTSILLDNGIRHSTNGKEVAIRLQKEKNYAILSVSNDGDEIPPEQRNYLFERFYRLDAARAGEDSHYGLGLAIAKAIVLTHKGTIDVQCHDGKVEFKAKLPLHSRNSKK